jgi:hypothetical protein
VEVKGATPLSETTWASLQRLNSFVIDPRLDPICLEKAVKTLLKVEGG